MKIKRLALAAALLAAPASLHAEEFQLTSDSTPQNTVQPAAFLGVQNPTGATEGEIQLCNCSSPGCMGGLSCQGDCYDGSDLDLGQNGHGIFSSRFLNGCCEKDEAFHFLPEVAGIQVGGWTQFGYHNKNLSLFNSRKHDFQLHQAWFYAERETDGSNGLDIGGRIDYLYGTDGPDTQAFGIENGHWDTSWDHGTDYGHAIPQVYGEVAYGNWSAKVGKFFTIIGYEVVAAPDNFFYSHAYTMYNSEPFTHTGALMTYTLNDSIEYYGGYVFGWDSGFEDNGDSFLGGTSVDLTEDINVTSTLIVGRMNDAMGDENGFMTSTVMSVQLTEPLSYVFQTDFLDTEDANGNTVRETFGINQYLFRDVCDKVSIGTRFEWWNVAADSVGLHGSNAMNNANLEGDFNVYAVTFGVNLKPHPNAIIRPEIRWDWVYGDSSNFAAADVALLDEVGNEQTTFGIDTILTF